MASQYMTAEPIATSPLAGQVILVTGGGQGLGRAAALRFAAAGATVVLLGRTVAKLEQTYDAIIAANGPMPAILPMDLQAAGDRDFELLAQSIAQQLHHLDAIVHCASAFHSLSPLSLQSPESWQELLRVNAIAPFAINRACESLLKQSPRACVILVGESHGHRPVAYWGGYAVSKAALEAYFKIQAEEWGDLPNLRIHLAIPGPIPSPLRARTHPAEDKASLPRIEAVADWLLDLMTNDQLERRGRILEYPDTRSG